MEEKKIWETFINVGMTPSGAAALMGNLKAESNLESTNLQNTYERKLGYTDGSYTAAVDSGSYTNFANDAAGYGLAQWTYHTRKAALLAFAKGECKSIGDLDMQLKFLVKELKNDYPALFNTLCTSTNVRTASDAVLTQFERPADMSDAVKNLRAEYSERFYNDNHDEEALPNPPCPTAEGTLILNGVTYRVIPM